MRLLLTFVLALSALFGATVALGARSSADVAVAIASAEMTVTVTRDAEPGLPAAPAEERRDDADPGDDADDDDVGETLAPAAVAPRVLALRGTPLARPAALAPPRQLDPSVDVPPPRRA